MIVTLLPTPFFLRTIIVQEKSRGSYPAASRVKMFCHSTMKPATQPPFLPHSCSANPSLYKTCAATTLWRVCPSLYASRNTFTNTFLSKNHNCTREIKGFLPSNLKSQDALTWHWQDQNQQHNHHFYLATTQLISICIKLVQQQHYGSLPKSICKLQHFYQHLSFQEP